jgi:hypothetical protein
MLHTSISAAKKHTEKRKSEAMHNLRLALEHDLRLTDREAFKVAGWIDQYKRDLMELVELEDDMALSFDKSDSDNDIDDNGFTTGVY